MRTLAIIAGAATWLLLMAQGSAVYAQCMHVLNKCDGDGDSSGSSYADDQAKVDAAANAINLIGDYLQKQDDRAQQQTQQAEQQRLQQEQIDAARQQNEAAQSQKNFQAIGDFEDSMGGDWESRAASSSKGSAPSKAPAPTKIAKAEECNCREVVGSCTAQIAVVKKMQAGADFKVTSSAPRCSKVTYFIDNSPRITVLNNTNTAMEHAAGLTEINAQTFEVESCKLCGTE